MVWDVYDFVFERNYHAAVEYYRKNGDLECRSDYVDENGIRLGAWLTNLRTQYQKRGREVLTHEQFDMMNSIGMRWGSKYDVQWDSNFDCLVSYINRTGNRDIPGNWKEGDVALGRWFRLQKELYSRGELRGDRTNRLLSLGLDLKYEDPWEMKFQLARTYSEQHGGSLKMPADLIINGIWLNKWINEQRLTGEGKRKKKLTDDQKRRLESIGMVFRT